VARRGPLPLVLSLALAVPAGALHALALPPFAPGALAWVALVPVIALLHFERRPWAGFVLGWAFGLGAGALAAGWLYETLAWSFDLRRVVAVGFTGVAVATYTLVFGVFGALTVRLQRGWLPASLAAPLAWGAAEWLRTDVAGGIPWLLYGHSQYETPALLQLAEIGGVPLVSVALVWVNALLAHAALGRGAQAGRVRLLGGALALVVGLAAYGQVRMASLADDGEAVPVAAVQRAVPQSERWWLDTREPNLAGHLEATREAVAGGARLVVWSETALDFPLDAVPDLGARVADALGGEGHSLLAGANVAREGGVANSVLLFDAHGDVRAAYDKRVLVPFAERRPTWFDDTPFLHDSLAKLVADASYVTGTELTPIPVAGLRVGVLICFESTFPDLSRELVDAGATVLVNMSNDAFFRRGAAEQHLAATVARAVETRRPLLRVTNRGVGAGVEPTGRIAWRIERDDVVTKLAELAPRSGRTLFVRGGHRLPLALGALALLGCVYRKREASV